MRYVITIIALVSLPFLHGCAVVAVGAAAGGGYVVGEDPRPVAVMSEDQRTEFRIHVACAGSIRTAHVNATSYNRSVLLTGEAPNAKDKADIERFARGVEGVRGIYNEIRVGAANRPVRRARRFFRHLESQNAVAGFRQAESGSHQSGDRGRNGLPDGHRQAPGSERRDRDRPHDERRAKSRAVFE